MANESLILDVTWNTATAPIAVEVDVTDTASDPESKLLDMTVDTASVFAVRKDGGATAMALALGGAVLDANALTVTGTVSVSETVSVNGTTALSAPGVDNYFFGPAGNLVLTGERNTAVGGDAAIALTTGSDTTAVGYSALKNATGERNTAVGSGAATALTTASDTTAVGFSALTNATGDRNTAVGSGAATALTTGSDTTAVGYSALTNATGERNTAVGSDAAAALTTGSDTTAVGSSALTNATGERNTAVGADAAAALTTGSDSTAVGYSALTNSTGANNTAIGSEALRDYVGSNAVAVGATALAQATGASNTAVGTAAGSKITTGTSNIFVGWNAGGSTTSQLAAAVNTIVVGYDTGATHDNQIVMGNATSDELVMFGQRMTLVQQSLRNFFWGTGGNRTATGGVNTGVGYNCFAALTTAEHNVAIGDQAASSHQTGTGSVWIGSQAGRLSTACIDVTHIGYQAGELQVAGVGDVGVGRRALQNAGYAANNTCIGDSTGWKLDPIPINPSNLGLGYTQGFSNVMIGYVAGEANVTGSDNVIIGGGANTHATSGKQNVIIGSQAMITNAGAGGDGNVGIGYGVLRDYTGGDAVVIGSFGFYRATGIRNTGVGVSVGSLVVSGSLNTFIGWGAGADVPTPSTISNAVAIGYNVQPTADNQVMIGNPTITQTILRGELNYGSGPSILSSPAAAVHQFGAANSAAPVAQTLRAQSVAAGTSNQAGVDLTVQASRGTGTGVGGDIVFQVAPAGSSGSTQNAYVDAMTIASDQNVAFAASVSVAGEIDYGSGPSIFSSPAAAVHQLGAADAGAPAAQTLRAQGVVAGTSNHAGEDLTVQASRGTGTGAGGDIVFQVAPPGSSGSTQNAYVDAVTIASDKNVAFAAGISAVGGAALLTGTAPPAGGTAGTGLTLSSTANFGIFFGSGAPTLAAAQGSLYMRTDGSGTNDRAYVNTDGSTGWTALVTVA